MHQHNFFYADDDVELYDITIYLTQPYYDLVHAMLADLILDYYKRNGNKTLRILDVGPGTGKELINILSQIENVEIVAVDVSARMIEAAKSKLSQSFAGLKSEEKIIWINDDIRNLTADELIKPIAKGQMNNDFDIVLSAFTLHHLNANEKNVLYSNFYKILKPEGLFINADLFGYANRHINLLSNSLSKEFMRKQLTKPDEQFLPLAEKLSQSQKLAQLEKWIKHWDEENIHLPMFGNFNNGQSEVALLKRANFIQPEIIYRYLHTAITICEK